MLDKGEKSSGPKFDAADMGSVFTVLGAWLLNILMRISSSFTSLNLRDFFFGTFFSLIDITLVDFLCRDLLLSFFEFWAFKLTFDLIFFFLKLFFDWCLDTGSTTLEITPPTSC